MVTVHVFQLPQETDWHEHRLLTHRVKSASIVAQNKGHEVTHLKGTVNTLFNQGNSP